MLLEDPSADVLLVKTKKHVKKTYLRLFKIAQTAIFFTQFVYNNQICYRMNMHCNTVSLGSKTKYTHTHTLIRQTLKIKVDKLIIM